MAYFSIQPIKVATSSPDQSGLLILAEMCLVAVIIRLDAGYHGEAAGKWFIEVGFGRCGVPSPEPFARPSDALRWIARRLDSEAGLSKAELDEIDLAFDAPAVRTAELSSPL